MESGSSNDIKLSVSRLNIISVGRMAIKTLIDKSCFEPIDDTSSEVFNFCNIVENMFYFCLKNGNVIYSANHKKHPWNFIKICLGSCGFSQSVGIISGMENLKHNFAKLRAWIRYALLEKRLSDYLEILYRSLSQIRNFYTDSCIFMCPEYQHFTNSLLGLKTIDFNIDLKGENLNQFGFHPIDYTPYLQYIQNPLSVLDDLAENCNHDSDSGNTDDHSSILSSSCPWKEKFLKIELKLKTEVEQKGYLEEMLRVQEAQVKTMESAKRGAFLEMKQLENVVLELQIQLTLLHEQYSQELSLLDDAKIPLLTPPRLSSVTKSAPPLSALNEACSFSANDEDNSHQPHQPSTSTRSRQSNLFEHCQEQSYSERLRVVQPGVLMLPTDKPFKVGRQELEHTESFQTPNTIKMNIPTIVQEENGQLLPLRGVKFSEESNSSDEERIDEGEDVLLQGEVFLNTPSTPQSHNNSQPHLVDKPPSLSSPHRNGVTEPSPNTLEPSDDGNQFNFNSGEAFSSLEYESMDTPEVVRRARQGTKSHYYQLMSSNSMCRDDCDV